jgi:hypothetical protein
MFHLCQHLRRSPWRAPFPVHNQFSLSMNPRFFSLRRLVASCFQDPLLDASTLARTYAEMTDEHLRQINPAELTQLARPLWREEVARRRADHKRG